MWMSVGVALFFDTFAYELLQYVNYSPLTTGIEISYKNLVLKAHAMIAQFEKRHLIEKKCFTEKDLFLVLTSYFSMQ